MEGFSKAEFLRRTDAERTALCRELEQLLTEQLAQAPEFHAGVAALVSVLRSHGHDLWSFDESDDFEAWCPNWANPSGPGIVLTFRHGDGVTVEWSTRAGSSA